MPKKPRKPLPPPELEFSLHKARGWRGEYARLGRWRDRIRASHSEADVEDFLYAFFQATSNLRDWVQAEKVVPQARLENLYRESFDLRLAQDVGNASKHRGLTDPKVGREFSLVREAVDPGQGLFDDDATLTILSGGRHYDAFELVERCWLQWTTFLAPSIRQAAARPQ